MRADGRIYGDPWWSAVLNRWKYTGVRGEHVGPCCRAYRYARQRAEEWPAATIRPLYVWTRRYAW